MYWRWRGPLRCRSSPSSISGSRMTSRLSLARPVTRLVLGASLALLPLVSAWNLMVPNRQIQIGPTLGGVTNEMPVTFSWSSIHDGSFQKAVASRLTEAFALRRILIRINNEVRTELFGEVTATLIHSLKGAYDFDLFPQGGVHWNDVGGARAVSALVDEINRQAGREIVPSFTFTYTLSSAAGADRELVDLLNVFFPPLAYLTPKVKYTTPASCADHPARLLDVAMVGSSFSHLPARILIQHNCLSGLNLYYYARLGRFGGVPYRELQRNLGEAELRRLRDAKIMILEENEAFAARNGYVDILRDVVTKP